MPRVERRSRDLRIAERAERRFFAGRCVPPRTWNGKRNMGGQRRQQVQLPLIAVSGCGMPSKAEHEQATGPISKTELSNPSPTLDRDSMGGRS